eukprot:5010606-Pyramimonas_sp.AAC.1
MLSRPAARPLPLALQTVPLARRQASIDWDKAVGVSKQPESDGEAGAVLGPPPLLSQRTRVASPLHGQTPPIMRFLRPGLPRQRSEGN